MIPVDEAPTGIDLDAIKRLHPFLRNFGRAYFRYRCTGFENVPPTPTLLVANHSGGKIPVDMFLFGSAWYDHFGYTRPVRALLHDILFNMNAWIGKSLFRIGCVPASVKNAHHLFDGGESVLVLPGGDYETFRPFRERYLVDFGGRSGFARVALRSGVPITPCVTVGSHEIFFVLRRGERLARIFRFKRFFRANAFPIIFGWPAGLYFGPLPSPLPLPAKIETEIMPPLYWDRAEEDHRAFTQADADNPEAVKELALVVQRRMQARLTELGSRRRLPILG